MPPGSTSKLHQFSCGHCGYDLRGTTPGRPCPECGTISQTDVDAYTGFDHSSRRIVYGYGWRVPLLALLVIIGAPVVFVVMANAVDSDLGLPFAFGFIGLAFGILLVPRWKDGTAEIHCLHATDRICRLVRWGSFGWVLLFGYLLLDSPNLPQALHTVLLILGATQFLFAFVVLQRLSNWMNQRFCVETFGFLQFGVVVVILGFVASLIVELIFPVGGSVAEVLFVALILVVVLGCLGLVVALLDLSKTAIFHILHYHQNKAIEQRRLERLREERARHQTGGR